MSAGRKPKMTYTKVTVNIPTPLVHRFDKLCAKEGFTRQEAVKQAIREFIHTYTPEDEAEPEEVREYMKNLALGFADAAKELPNQPQALKE